MELIVLGSGTALPSKERSSPAFAVLLGSALLLFDTGSGTMRRLAEADLDYLNVDVLFYTHLHPDHTNDLVPFLFATKYQGRPRAKPLRIIGARGFTEYFRGIEALVGPWIRAESYRFTVEDVFESTVPLPGGRVIAKPVKHAQWSVGYRIESVEGKVLTYSGDTDYCPEIVELGKDADLLILECSFPDDRKVDGHLTPTLAAHIATEANCRKLLLTHFYPPCDPQEALQVCQRKFKGPIMLATDLLRLQV